MPNLKKFPQAAPQKSLSQEDGIDGQAENITPQATAVSDAEAWKQNSVCVLVCVSVYKCVLVCISVCQCVLVCVSVC